ncbi:hypothetical protein PHYSODRAFT_529656 [Phytophthora sojae]|uniref:Retrotransposon gag domain-containing protein n=1 Tax=Phytophthora sojae (strain P6497) TaxID=1094619 RepID=G5ABF8_PHYSP|nr:hypothetical protein PHYSODRAFT_529656 [Phytophthora sojae]EGZ06683.1 hypothetical protein PHYSODRAFT_529656 [Phytophthora sojae]|eukprot:XP_009537447.1 hypothetical protein PHYSODRAFT_529656 [Phytophthora sojae]
MGMEDVEHFDEALRRMTAMYFPKQPASKVRQYLRETRKPSNMSVEEYVARLHQINELIQFLPPPNNRLTNHELREIVESNMPAVWQKKYDESGQDYETLEELVAYSRHAEQKRNKKQGNAPRKWCEFHKSRSHDTSECRAKNKSKEEAHFMDVEVTETCYKLQHRGVRRRHVAQAAPDGGPTSHACSNAQGKRPNCQLRRPSHHGTASVHPASKRQVSISESLG